MRVVDLRSEPVIDANGEQIARRGTIQDITERHAVEEALRASQRQLQVITDSLPAMISYVDTDLRYQSVNKTYEEFFQRPRETIIGMRIHDLVEADVASMAARQIQIALAGTPTSTDVTRTYPDGLTRDMSFNIIPDRQRDGKIGGVFMLGIDITERKAIEDALRTSQNEMRTVLDNVAATISYIDTNLHYRFVNQALATMLGLVAEDMPGMSLHDVVNEQMFKQIEPWLNRAMAGEQVAFDIERTYPVVGTRDMNLSFVPDFDATNTVQGLYILGTDVTWRKTAEEKMRVSDTRLRLVTDHLPVFIGYIDPDMRYRFVNEQYETTFGRPREEILGMQVKDVIGAERFSMAEPYLRRGLAGEQVKVEVPWPVHEKAHSRLLRTIVPDFGPDGEVLGIFVMAQELGQRDGVNDTAEDQND
jgi:PAS domain S-box-containing protein